MSKNSMRICLEIQGKSEFILSHLQIAQKRKKSNVLWTDGRTDGRTDTVTQTLIESRARDEKPSSSKPTAYFFHSSSYPFPGPPFSSTNQRSSKDPTIGDTITK